MLAGVRCEASAVSAGPCRLFLGLRQLAGQETHDGGLIPRPKLTTFSAA